MEPCRITRSCGPGLAAARDRGIASCAADRIPDTERHGLGAPSKASYFSCGSKEAEHTERFLHVSECVTPFPAWDQGSPQSKRDPAPPSPRAAGCSRRTSICTDATGWTRACNPKLKPSEAFFFFPPPPLSFTWKRQDTRCTLSGNNNDHQNRRILIGFNIEADKRGEQQRKQYYTILRTINHLLVQIRVTGQPANSCNFMVSLIIPAIFFLKPQLLEPGNCLTLWKVFFFFFSPLSFIFPFPYVFFFAYRKKDQQHDQAAS